MMTNPLFLILVYNLLDNKSVSLKLNSLTNPLFPQTHCVVITLSAPAVTHLLLRHLGLVVELLK